MNLFCKLVGAAGNPFSVRVDATDLVDELKKSIKKEKPNGLEKVDADRLQLYFAKKDGAWLSSFGCDATALQRGEIPECIRGLLNDKSLLDATATIGGMISEANLPPPSTQQIHLLVDILPITIQLPMSIAQRQERVIPRKRKERWDDLNRTFAEISANSDNNKRLKKSTAYSSLEWEKIKGVYEGIIDDKYIQPVKTLPQDTLKDLVKMMEMKLQSYGNVSGNEAKRLYFIEPIFLYVTNLFDPEDRVGIRVEESLSGKYIQANGYLDFVLTRGNKRVCIVEAKEDDMVKGLAQDLVGMEVASDVGNVEIVYGIVTNFSQWIFLKRSDDKIDRDDDSITLKHGIQTELARIAGKVYSILADDK